MPAAAEDGHSADDYGGDRLEPERITHAGRRLPRLADEHGAGQGGEHAAEHVEHNGEAADVDTSEKLATELLPTAYTRLPNAVAPGSTVTRAATPTHNSRSMGGPRVRPATTNPVNDAMTRDQVRDVLRLRADVVAGIEGRTADLVALVRLVVLGVAAATACRRCVKNGDSERADGTESPVRSGHGTPPFEISN